MAVTGGGTMEKAAPVVATENFAVAFSAQTALASSTGSVTLALAWDGGSTQVVSRLGRTAGIRTVYPKVAPGTEVGLLLTVAGVSDTERVTLAYVYAGQGLEYSVEDPVRTFIGDGWSNGSGYWSMAPSMDNAFSCNLRTRSEGQSYTTAPYFQLPAAKSDNLVVHVAVFNESAAKNDYLQVQADTNSWGSTVIDIGDRLPRYDGNYPDNSWRTNEVSANIVGLTGSETLQVGLKAISGGLSGKYLYAKIVKIEFKTDVASDGFSYRMDDGYEPFGADAFSYGDRPLGAMVNLQPRPANDLKDLVVETLLFRQSRNTTANQVLQWTGTWSGIASSNVPCDNLTFDSLEAGETNLLRFVATYSSAAGFATGSPQSFPGNDYDGQTYTDGEGRKWIVDVVRHLGTVWINEIYRDGGTTYVELAAHAGRAMPSDPAFPWRVDVGGVEAEIPGHAFADQANGIGFLTVALPTPPPDTGTATLFNGANIAEFSHEYDCSGGTWGATGIGPYATSRDERTMYWKNFGYGPLPAPTPDALNETEGVNAKVFFNTVIKVLDDEGEPLQYATVSLSNRVTGASSVSPSTSKTGLDGLTEDVFVSEVENSETNSVDISVSTTAFGFFPTTDEDPVVSHGSPSSTAAGAVIVTNEVVLAAGPGLEEFEDGLPAYWTRYSSFGPSSGNLGNYWSWSSSAHREELNVATREIGTGSAHRSTNPLSSRRKRVAVASLDTSVYRMNGAVDTGWLAISTESAWVYGMDGILQWPAFSNKSTRVTSSTPETFKYLAARKIESASDKYYAGFGAIAGGRSSSRVTFDNLRYSFQDMIVVKNAEIVSVDNAESPNAVRFDLTADLEAWGTNIVSVIPTVHWTILDKDGNEKSSGETCLTSYIDWSQMGMGYVSQEADGTLSLFGDKRLVATNVLSRQALDFESGDKVEYYFQVSYDPDDGDPDRYSNGALVEPEVRYFPDNATMTDDGQWVCFAEEGYTHGEAVAEAHFSPAAQPDKPPMMLADPLNWDPFIKVSVTNCTGGAIADPSAAAAFNNPAYTKYSLVHTTNAEEVVTGYVTTNSLGVGIVTADESLAIWQPIGYWEDFAIASPSLTNRFALVAQNNERVPVDTEHGPWGDISMELKARIPSEVAGAATFTQVAETPREFTFSGDILNPAAQTTVNDLNLFFSADNEATWKKATVKPGSVTSLFDPVPGVDNGADYRITGLETTFYTNSIKSAIWQIREEDLPSGQDYDVFLRLDVTDGSSFEHSISNVAARIDLSPAEVKFENVPPQYTNKTSFVISVVNGLTAEDDQIVKFWYALDDANPATNDYADVQTISTGTLSTGWHTLRAAARDAAGNWQAEATVTNWYVDTTAPVSTFTVTPPTRTNANEVAFEMAFDGNPLNAERWTYVVSNLTDTSAAPIVGATTEAGFVLATPVASDTEISYQITAIAYDRAGNASAPVSYGWIYDTLAP
ncbi:MAG: hypothetical protein IJQ73_08175, partial [Kiritimatiellae bacterium]|nr:hypothetical protein [Kiritimatiellia bacterium]